MKMTTDIPPEITTPDARMKKILTDAVAVENATARAIVFRPRDDAFFFYPGESSWTTPFVGGSHEFMHNHPRLLDTWRSREIELVKHAMPDRR